MSHKLKKNFGVISMNFFKAFDIVDWELIFSLLTFDNGSDKWIHLAHFYTIPC